MNMSDPAHSPLRLFLSGPMSAVKDYNIPLFMDVAQELRAQGFEIINPIEVFRQRFGAEFLSQPRRVYMRIAAELICDDGTDGIVMLPEWVRSTGSSAELALAYSLQQSIYLYDPVRRAVDVSTTKWRLTDAQTITG